MSTDIYISIANIIKNLRDSKHISRDKLSKELMISSQALYNYEHNLRNIDINLFAEILDIFNKTAVIKNKQIIILEDEYMENLKLKDILRLNEIKKGIVTNLIKDNELVDQLIKKTIALDSNVTSIEFEFNGKSIQFENTLHLDKKKELIFLECRIFNNETGGMIEGYLEVLDKNLNIVREGINDVWDYADWEPAI